jgi:starch synthase
VRVLFVSSEIYPLAKTGGLADVSAALPSALATLGAEMHLIMPGYPSAIEAAASKSSEFAFADFMGAGPVRLISGRTPDSGLPIWLVDCPRLYQRGGGPYQDQHGQDWPDNLRRFALFSQIAARFSRGELLEGFHADILHANDWHAGLAPAVLAGTDGRRPATVFTMHNLAFQGVFPALHHSDLGPIPGGLDPRGVEFYGQISLLKAGIYWSDRLTTVSPTYAREILTSDYGYGLDGLLRLRADHLIGILNGADYRIWDPVSDGFIPASFTVRNIRGKRICKAALQTEFGLDPEPEVPIVAYMSRMTDQKMADVVAQSLTEIADSGAQCVIFGDGDRRISDEFDRVARCRAGRVAARTGYEEDLAHLVLAGGDILLHPARFEPCGLTQLYAMRYGTLPIVRSTGGLSDTVVDASDDAIASGTATGFAFEPPERGPMLACLKRALDLYHQPLAWRKIQRQAMTQDFSWEKSAARYLALYRSMGSESDGDDRLASAIMLKTAAG